MDLFILFSCKPLFGGPVCGCFVQGLTQHSFSLPHREKVLLTSAHKENTDYSYSCLKIEFILGKYAAKNYEQCAICEKKKKKNLWADGHTVVLLFLSNKLQNWT